MQRIAVLLSVLLCSGACDLPYAPTADNVDDEVARRRGVLVSARETVVDSDAYAQFVDVELATTSGLHVLARVRVPLGTRPGDARAAVVLVGGRDTGRDAVRHVGDTTRALAIAPEYPATLKLRDGAELIERIHDFRGAGIEMAASLQLLADYITRRPEVDSTRLALVGVSFGGFFAPLAAAGDTRFRNVALLYAAGDLRTLVAANITEDLPSAARELGAELAVLPVQALEPLRHVGRIAPRPVLLVNGRFDDRIPLRSARKLIDAVRAPKDVVWLPTGHLETTDTLLIRELVDTSFARMPLLRRR